MNNIRNQNLRLSLCSKTLFGNTSQSISFTYLYESICYHNLSYQKFVSHDKIRKFLNIFQFMNYTNVDY